VNRPLIWISAGEASGDLVGSLLVPELRKLLPSCRIEAVGGAKLYSVCDEMLDISTDWGAIGIARSLPKVPRLYFSYVMLRDRARHTKPDLVIPIDFGAFNVPLARRVRRIGSKVLYYMPPGSWRKDKQGSDLPAVADRIATPFAWSADLLSKMGANAAWVGHPLLDLFKGVTFGPRNSVVAVLPGSRDHEVRSNLPTIAKACRLLQSSTDAVRFTILRSPTVDEESLRRDWSQCANMPADIADGPNPEILARARAAIICSGSATLEAAIAGCPMVVVYKGDWNMQLEYKIRQPKFDFIALPSILLGRQVCTELIQEAAAPERIAQEVLAVYQDGGPRYIQRKDLEAVVEQLGSPGASERTAQLALELLSGRRAEGC
jgi:lipid-A-disaccharide synthase